MLDGPSHQAAGISVEQALRVLKRNLVREIKKRRISSLPTTGKKQRWTVKSFIVQPAIVHKDRRYPVGPRISFPDRFVELRDARDQDYCMLPDFWRDTVYSRA